MTTDAIYTDDVGVVKYHFVISQVRPVSPLLTTLLPPSRRAENGLRLRRTCADGVLGGA